VSTDYVPDAVRSRKSRRRANHSRANHDFDYAVANRILAISVHQGTTGRQLPGVEIAAIGNGETTPLPASVRNDFGPKASLGTRRKRSPRNRHRSRRTSLGFSAHPWCVEGCLRNRTRGHRRSSWSTSAWHIWPNQDPIGKRLVSGPDKSMTVVGVVHDLKSHSFDQPDVPHVYFSAYQRSNLAMTVFLRARRTPLRLPMPSAALCKAWTHQPVFGVRTLEEVVARSLA
jgi:hypothetical protein